MKGRYFPHGATSETLNHLDSRVKVIYNFYYEQKFLKKEGSTLLIMAYNISAGSMGEKQENNFSLIDQLVQSRRNKKEVLKLEAMEIAKNCDYNDGK
jgi:hypothetical protein